MMKKNLLRDWRAWPSSVLAALLCVFSFSTANAQCDFTNATNPSECHEVQLRLQDITYLVTPLIEDVLGNVQVPLPPPLDICLTGADVGAFGIGSMEFTINVDGTWLVFDVPDICGVDGLQGPFNPFGGPGVGDIILSTFTLSPGQTSYSIPGFAWEDDCGDRLVYDDDLAGCLLDDPITGALVGADDGLATGPFAITAADLTAGFGTIDFGFVQINYTVECVEQPCAEACNAGTIAPTPEFVCAGETFDICLLDAGDVSFPEFDPTLPTGVGVFEWNFGLPATVPFSGYGPFGDPDQGVNVPNFGAIFFEESVNYAAGGEVGCITIDYSDAAVFTFGGPIAIDAAGTPQVIFGTNAEFVVQGTIYGAGGFFGFPGFGLDPQGDLTFLDVNGNAVCQDVTNFQSFVLLDPMDVFWIEDYQCNNDNSDDTNASATVTIPGANITGGLPGFDPINEFYFVTSGTGIYAPIDLDGDGFLNDPFDFGNIPGFGFLGPILAAGDDFSFAVVEDQAWSLEICDEAGCCVSLSGMFDLPEPEFTGLNSQYCVEDPPNYIYDEAIFEPSNNGLVYVNNTTAGEFFGNLGVSNVGFWYDDQLVAGAEAGQFSIGEPTFPDITATIPFVDVDGNGVFNSGDQLDYTQLPPFDPGTPPAGFVNPQPFYLGIGVFDPFFAGIGQQLVSYCVFDDPNDDCVVCDDQVISVYPVMEPSFQAPVSYCIDGESDPIIDLDLVDIGTILGYFSQLEPAFDPAANGAIGATPQFDSAGNPVGFINEVEFYIEWEGNGLGAADYVQEDDDEVWDGTMWTAGGGATFDASVAGVGTHIIKVTVGYANCELDYEWAITVYEDAVAEAATDFMRYCSTGSNIDLSTLFTANTTNGGTFYVNGNPWFGSDLADIETLVGTHDICYAVGPNQDNAIFGADPTPTLAYGILGYDYNGDGALVAVDGDAIAIYNPDDTLAGFDTNDDGLVDLTDSTNNCDDQACVSIEICPNTSDADFEYPLSWCEDLLDPYVDAEGGALGLPNPGTDPADQGQQPWDNAPDPTMVADLVTNNQLIPLLLTSNTDGAECVSWSTEADDPATPRLFLADGTPYDSAGAHACPGFGIATPVYFNPYGLSDLGEVEVCATIVTDGADDPNGPCNDCTYVVCHEINIISTFDPSLVAPAVTEFCASSTDIIDMDSYLGAGVTGAGFFTVYGPDPVFDATTNEGTPVVATFGSYLYVGDLPAITGDDDTYVIRYTQPGSGACARFDEFSITLIAEPEICDQDIPAIVCEDFFPENPETGFNEYVIECPQCEPIVLDGEMTECLDPFNPFAPITPQVQFSGIPDGSTILSVELTYDYQPCPDNCANPADPGCCNIADFGCNDPNNVQGDHDGYQVTINGVPVLTVAPPTPGDPANDIFGTQTLRWDDNADNADSAPLADLYALLGGAGADVLTNDCGTTTFEVSLASNANSTSVTMTAEVVYIPCSVSLCVPAELPVLVQGNDPTNYEDVALECGLALDDHLNFEITYDEVTGEISGATWTMVTEGLGEYDAVQLTTEVLSCTGCNGVDIENFNVLEEYSAEIEPAATVCQSNGVVDLTQYFLTAPDYPTTDGGYWTGEGVLGGDIFDPMAVAGDATYTLTYTLFDTPGGACGVVQGSIDITVDAAINACFVTNGAPQICTNETLTIDPNAGNPEPFTDANGDGMWNAAEDFVDANGDGIYDNESFTDNNGNGVFDGGDTFSMADDTNGNGIYDNEEYTDANGNGMWDDAEAFMDMNGDGMYSMNAFNPTGATTTGLMITSGGAMVTDLLVDGTIDPVTGMVSYTIPADWEGHYTIVHTMTNGTCEDTCSEDIFVTAAFDATLQEGPVCITDAMTNSSGWLYLPSLYTENTTQNGVWTGAGVTGDWFDPAVAGPGAHTLTYIYDDNGDENVAGTCGISLISDDITITVPETPTITPSATEVCDCTDITLDLGLGAGAGSVIGGFSSGSMGRADAQAAAGTDPADYKPTSEDAPEGDPLVLTVNVSGIPAGATITNIDLLYEYSSTTGTAQGDHDGYSLTGPAGEMIVDVADGGGGPTGAGDNHWGTETLNVYNTEDGTNLIPATDLTVDGCDLELPFVYTIASNSQYWDASLTVNVSYETAPGQGSGLVATIASTGTELANVLSLDPGTGLYILNTCGLAAYGAIDITYAQNDPCGDACGAETTVTVQVLEGDAPTIGGIPGIVCADTPNFTLTASIPGGTWTLDGVEITDPLVDVSLLSAGNHTVTYTLGGTTGGCEDGGVTQTFVVVDEATAGTVSLGSTCQAADDSSIDLTQYVTGTNGGNFSATVAPFISEIECTNEDATDISTSLFSEDFIEITAPAGTNLNGYALFFYDFDGSDASSSNSINELDDEGYAGGRVYMVWSIEGDLIVPDEAGGYGAVALDIDLVEVVLRDNDYDVVPEAGAGDIRCENAGIGLVKASFTETTYTIIDIDPANGTCVERDIIDTQASVDMDRCGSPWQFIGYGSAELDPQDYDETTANASDGINNNTNDGIFAACDGPFATHTAVDINTGDFESGNSTVVLTANGWYIVDSWGTNQQDGAGTMNNDPAGPLPTSIENDPYTSVLDYITQVLPTGDILNLDEIDATMFFDGQYCLQMGYEAGAGTACGSSSTGFTLQVLQDYDNAWDLPDNVCEGTDAINLNSYILDETQYIPPVCREDSFTASTQATGEGAYYGVFISEFHYNDYGFGDVSIDNHCEVVYGYSVVDNLNPALGENIEAGVLADNPTVFCEGVEISGPIGTDLSCYQLVFYQEQGVNEGLMYDVAYIGPDGDIMITDVAQNGSTGLLTPGGAGTGTYNLETGAFVDEGNTYLMQLWGEIDDDITVAPNGFDDWEQTNQCTTDYGTDKVGSRWFPILNMRDNAAAVGLYNVCLGEGQAGGLTADIASGRLELIEYETSTGFPINVGPDYTLAGPFAGIEPGDDITTVIDNITVGDGVGDLQSLQLCDDETWILTDAPSGVPDQPGFSNTFGYWNCCLDNNYVISQLTEIQVVISDEDLPDNYNITDITVSLTGQDTENAPNDIWRWYITTVEKDEDGDPFVWADYTNSAELVCCDSGDLDLNEITSEGQETCNGVYNNGANTLNTNNDLDDEGHQFGDNNANIPGTGGMLDDEWDQTINESLTDRCTKTGEITIVAYVSNTYDWEAELDVTIEYRQCFPIGEFYGHGGAGANVTLNWEDEDNPFWQYDPAANQSDQSPVQITYNVPNYGMSNESIDNDWDNFYIDSDGDVYDSEGCDDGCEGEGDFSFNQDNFGGEAENATGSGVYAAYDKPCMEPACENSSTLLLPVVSQLVADVTDPANTYCVTDAAIDLENFYVTGSNTDGVWSGPGVEGNYFNPGAAGPGSHVINYDVLGSGDCSSSDQLTIVVGPDYSGADLVYTEDGSDAFFLCAESGEVTLTGPEGLLQMPSFPMVATASETTVLTEPLGSTTTDGVVTVAVPDPACPADDITQIRLTWAYEGGSFGDAESWSVTSPTGEVIASGSNDNADGSMVIDNPDYGFGDWTFELTSFSFPWTASLSVEVDYVQGAISTSLPGGFGLTDQGEGVYTLDPTFLAGQNFSLTYDVGTCTSCPGSASVSVFVIDGADFYPPSSICSNDVIDLSASVTQGQPGDFFVLSNGTTYDIPGGMFDPSATYTAAEPVMVQDMQPVMVQETQAAYDAEGNLLGEFPVFDDEGNPVMVELVDADGNVVMEPVFDADGLPVLSETFPEFTLGTGSLQTIVVGHNSPNIGCTSYRTITIAPSADWTTETGGFSFCVSELPVQLIADEDGGMWMTDDGIIDENGMFTADLGGADHAAYGVTYGFGLGCTKTYVINVYDNPPAPSVAGEIANVCDGGSVGTITVSSTLSVNNFVLTDENGVDGILATSGDIYETGTYDFNLDDYVDGAGDYTFQVWNALGSCLSAPYEINVTSYAAPDFTYSFSCSNAGGVGTLVVEPFGGDGSDYQISLDGGASYNGFGANVFPIPLGENIEVMVQDDNGCTSAMQTVAAPLAVAANASATCPDADGIVSVSAAPTGGAGEGGYQVIINGTIYGIDALPVDVTGASDISVQAIDGNGCFSEVEMLSVANLSFATIVGCPDAATGDVMVTVETTGAVSWNGNASDATFTVPNGAGQSITVTVTEGDCEAQAIVDLPAAVAVSATVGCADADGMAEVSVALPTGGTPPYYVSFDGGANVSDYGTGNFMLAAGSYSLVVVDGNGCTSAATDINVDGESASPIFLKEASTTAICDESGQISLVVTADGEVTFNWYADAAGTMMLASGSTYEPTDVALGQTVVWVEAVSGNCTSDLVSVDYFYYSPVAINVSDISGCTDSGTEIVVALEITGGAGSATYLVNGSTDGLTGNFYSGTFDGGSPVTLEIVSEGTGCPAMTVEFDACVIPEAPIANDDTAVGPADADVISGTICDNDSGDITTIEITSDPNEGTVILSDDGCSFTYYPGDNYDGSDSFDYTVCGPGGCDDATVTVTSPTGDLMVDVVSDCDTNGDETPYFTIVIVGGTPPYDITGSFNFGNEDLEDNGSTYSVSFPGQNAEVYTFTVTDGTGATFGPIEVTEECTKVAIECISFAGEETENGNQLFWVTGSEYDNAKFIVESSTDGTHFEFVADVDAVGNSETPVSYDYLDKDAVSGTTYYRLTAVDVNGTMTQACDVISITRVDGPVSILDVYPVPASDIVSVSFTANAATDVTVEIHDVVGRLITAEDVATVSGLNTQAIDISTLPVGTYFVTINSGAETATTKFIKQD